MQCATYYKRESESVMGVGVCFFEVIEDVIVRQVEIYGSQYYWANRQNQKDDRFMIADKLASEIELNDDYLVSSSEFEDVWNRAINESRLKR